MDWKAITKILRLRRPAIVSADTSDYSSDDPTLHKVKLRTLFSQPLEPNNPDSKPKSSAADDDRETLEFFVADLFASVSAIKAAYAQLQLAQSPYDPESIQSADQSVVSEFKRISELKQSYVKNQILASKPVAAQIQEQKNLIKTFKITIKKLESELQSKDSEVVYLQTKLSDIESKNRALESKLHPNKSLASLDNLHLSALNPNHFLTGLRFAVRSIRSFVNIMEREMDAAGWDLNAAAASIHQIFLKPEHIDFAFESFLCCKMFSDFHRKDFNFEFLEARSRWNQRRFFDEFQELKFLKPKEICDRKIEFGKFCRERYLSLVHPKMEAAFFGGLHSGRGLTDSGFYNGFMEMAKRVWLLHCLLFSFEPELNGSVFQARRGSRFSEVYMESVADTDSIRGSPTVGFMVVPGFRVGSTVIQCKVYLS